MATEIFRTRRFQPETARMIEQADAIVDEYSAQGFTLTLRQLHYQFVSRSLYENTKANYKRLGFNLKKARDTGVIDWDSIEDRTRDMVTPDAWDSPAEIIESVAESYREDLWAGQGHRVEVWIEKDALTGTIGPVCDELRVAYTSARGNTSTTECYRGGKRIAGYVDEGLTPVVLQLADLDPKGWDMTRDLSERLSIYARSDVEVRRIGLNMDQVRRYRPPPNEVKTKDSTTPAYVAKFGTDKCWELDALAPDVIAGLIRSEIEPLIDQRAWAKAKRREAEGRRQLAALAEEWSAS